MPYRHLTPFERASIELLHRQGQSVRAIARELGRSPSTVSRELARNRSNHRRYRAVQAQRDYLQRRERSRKPHRLAAHAPLRRYVETKLGEDWAPEQIARTLPLDFPRDATMRISHETIYTFVYADKRANGTLYTHLRQAHRSRRRRGNVNRKRGLLPGRVSIEDRPKIVETRRRTGDWEADLVHGRRRGPAVLTLVERKHGFLLAEKVRDKRAYTVAQAILAAFRQIPNELVKTITFDNGKEFALFKTVEQALDAKTYFARPYAAWERGTNENTNGLLRQYLPKSADLHLLDERELNRIADKLNNRPRKRLDFRTPAHTFDKVCVALQP